MGRLLIIIAVFIPTLGQSASWYFGGVGQITGGLTNGTSWANAWTNPASIVWGSIVAGDTLYVSGGTTTQQYYEWIYPPTDRSGTAANPITVQIGQDAGHNGVAIFNNAAITMRPNSDHFHIKGGRNPNFVHPTNHQQLTVGDSAITNNIGFVFRNILGVTELQDTDPIVWFLNDQNTNILLSYIEVSGMSNTLCGVGCDWKGTTLLVTGSGTASNIVVEYCYWHDNTCQSIQASSGTSDSYDKNHVRFCVFTGNGEDFFELAGGGWTIRDCFLGQVKGYGKIHTDLFQFTGLYFKVYNNLIHEISHSILRMQTRGTDSTDGVGLSGNLLFYNNIITEKFGRTTDGGLRIEQLGVVHYSPANPATNVTVTNLVFANNLFFQSISNQVGGLQLALSPLITFSKGAVTNAWIKASKWVNNIVIDRQSGLNFPSSTNLGPTGYIPYTTNDLWVDYNLQWATNTALTAPMNVNYMDTTHSNVASNPFQFSNRTNEALFAGKLGDVFELDGRDTAALNTGYDMSSVFNFDALNRPRNVGGAWDRGPLELQETNLVVFLSFEHDLPGGIATDSSGGGNHGYRFTLSEDSYPSNRFAAHTASNLFRPLVSGRAMDFIWGTNATYGLYLRDGPFFGVTNHQRLTNMSTATIMCWGRYCSARRVDNTYDYSQDGNACLLSVGQSDGTVGTWELARFNNSIWLNNTRFMVATGDFGGAQVGNAYDRTFGKAGRCVVNFRDYGYGDNGNTTNWFHFAATWNNGVLKTYYNGESWSTNDLSAITTKLRMGKNGAAPYPYLGVGVNNHAGTPEFEDEAGVDYPNHGFLNGGMDQVRIYDRVLSHQEIIDVTYSEGSLFDGAPMNEESPPIVILTPASQLNGNVRIQGNATLR